MQKKLITIAVAAALAGCAQLPTCQQIEYTPIADRAGVVRGIFIDAPSAVQLGRTLEDLAAGRCRPPAEGAS